MVMNRFDIIVVIMKVTCIELILYTTLLQNGKDTKFYFKVHIEYL